LEIVATLASSVKPFARLCFCACTVAVALAMSSLSLATSASESAFGFLVFEHAASAAITSNFFTTPNDNRSCPQGCIPRSTVTQPGVR
jgi:hypothetical protein